MTRREIVRVKESFGCSDYHARDIEIDQWLDLCAWLRTLDRHRSRLACKVLGGSMLRPGELADGESIARELRGVLTL